VRSMLAVTVRCMKDLFADREVDEVGTRSHLNVIINDDRLSC